MKRAVCMGINAYGGGNDLQGCVNGVHDMFKWFMDHGFEVSEVTDSMVTVDTFLREVRYLIQSTEPGDVGVVYYSGHGTWDLDQNADETDGYDEALALYDGNLIDDQIHEVIKENYVLGAHLVFILDSCFSGTATRAADLGRDRMLSRFLPPMKRVRRMPSSGLPRPRRTKFMAKEDMVEVLMSGCGENEYSYETWYPSGWNGVFTHNLLRALDKGPGSYDTLHSLVVDYVNAQGFPQTPQLEGQRCNLEGAVFGDETPEPLPDPEPEPEPGFQCTCGRALRKWWKTRKRRS